MARGRMVTVKTSPGSCKPDACKLGDPKHSVKTELACKSQPTKKSSTRHMDSLGHVKNSTEKGLGCNVQKTKLGSNSKSKPKHLAPALALQWELMQAAADAGSAKAAKRVLAASRISSQQPAKRLRLHSTSVDVDEDMAEIDNVVGIFADVVTYPGDLSTTSRDLLAKGLLHGLQLGSQLKVHPYQDEVLSFAESHLRSMGRSMLAKLMEVEAKETAAEEAALLEWTANQACKQRRSNRLAASACKEQRHFYAKRTFALSRAVQFVHRRREHQTTSNKPSSVPSVAETRSACTSVLPIKEPADINSECASASVHYVDKACTKFTSDAFCDVAQDAQPVNESNDIKPVQHSVAEHCAHKGQIDFCNDIPCDPADSAQPLGFAPLSAEILADLEGPKDEKVKAASILIDSAPKAVAENCVYKDGNGFCANAAADCLQQSIAAAQAAEACTHLEELKGISFKELNSARPMPSPVAEKFALCSDMSCDIADGAQLSCAAAPEATTCKHGDKLHGLTFRGKGSINSVSKSVAEHCAYNAGAESCIGVLREVADGDKLSDSATSMAEAYADAEESKDMTSDFNMLPEPGEEHCENNVGMEIHMDTSCDQAHGAEPSDRAARMADGCTHREELEDFTSHPAGSISTKSTKGSDFKPEPVEGHCENNMEMETCTGALCDQAHCIEPSDRAADGHTHCEELGDVTSQPVVSMSTKSTEGFDFLPEPGQEHCEHNIEMKTLSDASCDQAYGMEPSDRADLMADVCTHSGKPEEDFASEPVGSMSTEPTNGFDVRPEPVQGHCENRIEMEACTAVSCDQVLCMEPSDSAAPMVDGRTHREELEDITSHPEKSIGTKSTQGFYLRPEPVEEHCDNNMRMEICRNIKPLDRAALMADCHTHGRSLEDNNYQPWGSISMAAERSADGEHASPSPSPCHLSSTAVFGNVTRVKDIDNKFGHRTTEESKDSPGIKVKLASVPTASEHLPQDASIRSFVVDSLGSVPQASHSAAEGPKRDVQSRELDDNSSPCSKTSAVPVSAVTLPLCTSEVLSVQDPSQQEDKVLAERCSPTHNTIQRTGKSQEHDEMFSTCSPMEEPGEIVEDLTHQQDAIAYPPGTSPANPFSLTVLETHPEPSLDNPFSDTVLNLSPSEGLEWMVLQKQRLALDQHSPLQQFCAALETAGVSHKAVDQAPSKPYKERSPCMVDYSVTSMTCSPQQNSASEQTSSEVQAEMQVINKRFSSPALPSRREAVDLEAETLVLPGQWAQPSTKRASKLKILTCQKRKSSSNSNGGHSSHCAFPDIDLTELHSVNLRASDQNPATPQMISKTMSPPPESPWPAKSEIVPDRTKSPPNSESSGTICLQAQGTPNTHNQKTPRADAACSRSLNELSESQTSTSKWGIGLGSVTSAVARRLFRSRQKK